MNRKTWAYIIIAALLLAILYLFVVYRLFLPTNYEPFVLTSLNETHQCENYTENCTCYGSLLIAESYPPQYQCKGFEVCKEHDLIIKNCRGFPEFFYP